MATLRKFVVKKPFKNFLPETTDFDIIEESVPSLKPGEFLVKAEYISVDPYMRSFATSEVPYEQFGFQVGKVVESKNTDYHVDTYVVSHSGWRDYTVLNGSADKMFVMIPYKPDIDDLPLSWAIGVLGMSGMTAYLGLLEVCNPKKGEVLCVSSAAGAVGSIVGQIGKLKGCTVVGFAGTDEKVTILKEELGFHHAFNYKLESNIKDALMNSVTGIDCYFDNVGGQLSDTVIQCMNQNGRIANCGSISDYGQTGMKKRAKIPTNIKIEAFSFTQWEWTQQREAVNEIKKWIQNGDIKVKETITNGFEQLPQAFINMLNGNNIGKTVVKV